VKTALSGGLAILVLALSACGSVSAGSPSPSPGRFDVVVTEKDTAASMRTGQTIEVVLHARPGLQSWTGVRSNNTAILAPIVDPAATAARGVTLAAFRAEGPGQVLITATASPVCPSSGVCPMFVALYQVDVTVS
jgi:phage tail protein X